METAINEPGIDAKTPLRKEDRVASDAISKDDVTIIIPVLNEEKAIPRVVEEVFRAGYTKLLVIDGYSTDNTVDILRRYGVPVIQQHGGGKTGALKTAVEHATTPYILVMDGDCTYSAAEIEKFLPHARHYDEIIGARRPQKGAKSISQSHKFGNRIITKTFNFLFGANLSDVLSGMYLLKTETARYLELDSADFTVEVEIAGQVARMGNITEVPISYYERVGKQKLSTWRDGPKILSALVKLARLYNPAFLLSLAAGATFVPGVAMLLWVLWEYISKGVFSTGWAFAGMILVLFGSQALAAGTISLIMKRMERRLARSIAAVSRANRD